MKIPEGYDEVINKDVDIEDCLILQKAIYGLVQAARQFWKKIVDKMQEGGFQLSEADPFCINIIYIDDMLIIGKQETIDDAIKVLQGHFQVKDPTSLEDYLGVQIVQSDDGKKAWLGQCWIIFCYKTVPKVPLLLNFFGVDAKYAKHLRAFGEMCVVADTDNKVGRTKIDPRGKISLFVGYSTQHAGDVYRLLNPKTSSIIHSRDVKWTGKTWAEF